MFFLTKKNRLPGGIGVTFGFEDDVTVCDTLVKCLNMDQWFENRMDGRTREGWAEEGLDMELEGDKTVLLGIRSLIDWIRFATLILIIVLVIFFSRVDLSTPSRQWRS